MEAGLVDKHSAALVERLYLLSENLFLVLPGNEAIRHSIYVRAVSDHQKIAANLVINLQVLCSFILTWHVWILIVPVEPHRGANPVDNPILQTHRACTV